MRLFRVGAEVARETQRLLHAVGLIPVRLHDMMAAKPVQLRHVGHAHGHIGIEQIAKAARLGVVAAQLENRVPRPGLLELALQAPEGERTFLKSKDAIDVRVVFDQYAPSSVHHGGKKSLGESFPERLEHNGIGEGVADAGAGEGENAWRASQLNRPGARRMAVGLGAKIADVRGGGEPVEERGHGSGGHAPGREKALIERSSGFVGRDLGEAGAHLGPIAGLHVRLVADAAVGKHVLVLRPGRPDSFHSRAEERDDRGAHGSGHVHGRGIDAEIAISLRGQRGDLRERNVAIEKKRLGLAKPHDFLGAAGVPHPPARW